MGERGTLDVVEFELIERRGVWGYTVLCIGKVHIIYVRRGILVQESHEGSFWGYTV